MYYKFIKIDYGRSIIIDDRAKYFINDEDCMYLFKSTLTKMIFGKFETICSVCHSAEGENHLVKLNCPCSFCEKCLGDYINNATEGKILLNQFEKSKYFFDPRAIIEKYLEK